jgi:hypothetical protein
MVWAINKILLQHFLLDCPPIAKNKFQIYTFSLIAMGWPARTKNEKRRMKPPLILFVFKSRLTRAGFGRY